MATDAHGKCLRRAAQLLTDGFQGAPFFIGVQPHGLVPLSIANLRTDEQVRLLRGILTSFEQHGAEIWIDKVPLAIADKFSVQNADVRAAVLILRQVANSGWLADGTQIMRVCDWLDDWLKAVEEHPNLPTEPTEPP